MAHNQLIFLTNYCWHSFCSIIVQSKKFLKGFSVMNKNPILASLCGLGLLTVANVASAIPTLQLDILNGTYCDVSCDEPLKESIVTTESSFSLYAYANPDGKATGPNGISLNDILGNTSVDFYLSIALSPKTNIAGNYGSIDVDGTTYQTANMTYGTPPVDAILKDIGGHSIYDTFYQEIAVNFNSADLSCDYNIQDNPGIGPQDPSGCAPGVSTMYFDTFDIDMSNLVEGFDLHFDLYAVDPSLTKQNGDPSPHNLVDFAPFSHDAQTNCCTTKVPEPGTAFLLGLGLLGFGMRKKFKH